MSYTDQDVERVAEALCVAEFDNEYWETLKDGADGAPDAHTYQREINHLRVLARAALEAMERDPVVHGDLLDRLTRVAEAGFHWWEAWADEGGYDGEYKHMDREQRIDHILCHDLLLALDALTPDYFDGLTGKPKYAVAAEKIHEPVDLYR